MKKGLQTVFAFALTLSVAALTACGGQPAAQNPTSYTKDNPMIIKFSHVVTEDSPKGKASKRFAALMAQKTGGRVKVEVYPSSQLYRDKDELEALQAGNVQLIAPSTAKMVGINPAFQVNDLPFLFKEHDAVVKFWDGEYGKKLFNSLESKNLKGLALWELGYKQFTSRKPIAKVEDFAGQKFRTQAGKVLDAQFKALGAAAATIAFGETYKQWYDNLPADIKKAFDESIQESTKYQRELAAKLDEESKTRIVKSGKLQMVQMTPEERGKFIQKMEPVYKEFENTIGKDMIDAARKM
ncbi:DctP family TRAP transporter solute-binding subunit [Effusibacillus dendaii]|uniref:C4-dicarboxylate ABC transporter n=1 Tax=Effusibacillus dendaii TaxID=2743772 RepID=A0A7I8DC36_9BACL|nr:DctP family TRAP transporter solute-binding subunit [Effusibacillus dendaii]BCJ86396.1 C4-dicarboxylate ABC transporter [Effusibacillus dendaii]